MKVKLNEDQERDKITTVQVELGLREYQVIRKLIKLGINSDEAEKLERIERQISSRFASVLYDTDEEVKVALEHVKNDVPEELRDFYLDPHTHVDEEFIAAGIMKPPEDKMVSDDELLEQIRGDAEDGAEEIP